MASPKTKRKPTKAVEPQEKVKRKPVEEKHPDKVQRKSEKRTKGDGKTPWYLLEGREAADAVIEDTNYLRKVPLASYRRNAVKSMQLYAGTISIDGISSTAFSKRLRYNLIKSIVDTAASILSAARTLPYCQTRGADWQLRRKALQRNQVTQQQVQDMGVFEQMDKAILDALVTRLGAVKVFEDSDAEGGLAGCERVLPLSLVWNPREAVAGDPRGLRQVYPINRDVLMEMYPDHETAIRKAPGPSAEDRDDFQLETDAHDCNLVMVVEAWQLPSGAESGDGKHIIAIKGAALHEEEWTRPRFPFGFIKGWEPSQLGFTGTSLADICRPAQLRIEQLADHIEKCQTLGSSPRVFLKKGSMVEPEQVTNMPMQTHLYDGDVAPTFFKFDATPHDFEATVEQIREQTLSMIGLNAQQVEGAKPAGVNSAVGQRAVEDIASKRHIRPLRFLEKAYLGLFQAIIDVNDAIATENPDFAIDRGVRDAWLVSSKWTDCMLEPSEARTACFPVSQLMGSVSSQLQTVSEWIAAGWTTPTAAKILMSMPDTEGQTDSDSVDERYSQEIVEEILDGKKPGVPPELDVLILAPILRGAYLDARINKAPEPILAQFRRTMDVVKLRGDAIKAAQAPAPAPMGAMPAPGPEMSVPGGVPPMGVPGLAM